MLRMFMLVKLILLLCVLLLRNQENVKLNLLKMIMLKELRLNNNNLIFIFCYSIDTCLFIHINYIIINNTNNYRSFFRLFS